MRTTRRIAPAIAAAGAALALTLIGCSSQAPATNDDPAESGGKDLATLNLAVSGTLNDGAIRGGIEEGFFAEEGLNIEFTVVPNPAAGLAAAQGGQVDLVGSTTIALLATASQGIPVLAVATNGGLPDEFPEGETAEDYEASGLYGSPANGITSIDQLEGRTIAVPARAAAMEVATSVSLDNAGISPDSINWVALDFASAVAALENGNVDAAALFPPFTDQAVAAGAPKIASPIIDFHEYGPGGYWITVESIAEKKAEQLAAFQRAVVKSNTWANENPDKAVAFALEAIDSPLSVEQVTAPYWPTDIGESSIERANEKMAKFGFIPAPLDVSKLIFRGE